MLSAASMNNRALVPRYRLGALRNFTEGKLVERIKQRRCVSTWGVLVKVDFFGIILRIDSDYVVADDQFAGCMRAWSY